MMRKKPGREPMPPETGRSLPIALLRAREAAMRHFRPHLVRLGITEQQWRVLRVLAEGGAMEAGSVAERACILAPSLSRILKALSGDRLVKTYADISDGRRTIVALTDKGRKLLSKAAPESAAIYARLTQAYGREEWEQMLDALERLQKALLER